MHKHSIYKLIYNAENISGLPVSHNYHRYYNTLKILLIIIIKIIIKIINNNIKKYFLNYLLKYYFRQAIMFLSEGIDFINKLQDIFKNFDNIDKKNNINSMNMLHDIVSSYY